MEAESRKNDPFGGRRLNSPLQRNPWSATSDRRFDIAWRRLAHHPAAPLPITRRTALLHRPGRAGIPPRDSRRAKAAPRCRLTVHRERRGPTSFATSVARAMPTTPARPAQPPPHDRALAHHRCDLPRHRRLCSAGPAAGWCSISHIWHRRRPGDQRLFKDALEKRALSRSRRSARRCLVALLIEQFVTPLLGLSAWWRACTNSIK